MKVEIFVLIFFKSPGKSCEIYEAGKFAFKTSRFLLMVIYVNGCIFMYNIYQALMYIYV